MSKINDKNETNNSSKKIPATKKIPVAPRPPRNSRRKPKATPAKQEAEPPKNTVRKSKATPAKQEAEPPKNTVRKSKTTPAKQEVDRLKKVAENTVRKTNPVQKDNRRRGKSKPPIKAKARDVRLKIKEGEKTQVLAKKRTNPPKPKPKPKVQKTQTAQKRPPQHKKPENKTQETYSPPKRTTRSKVKENQLPKEVTSTYPVTSVNIVKPETTTVSVRVHQSVAVLIDGNNIEMSIHSMMHSKSAMLDFDKVIPKILEDRGLNRLIYFREGLNISEKLAERLHKHYHGSVVPCHKSADIPLTITATQIAEKVDTIIIMSGDSDYVELVRHLKSRGVRVEIASVKATTAQILIDEADYSYEINKEDCFVFK